MKKILSILALALLSTAFAGCAGTSQSGLIPQASQNRSPDLIIIGGSTSHCSSCVGVPTTGGGDGVGTSAQNPGGCPMALRAKVKCTGGGTGPSTTSCTTTGVAGVNSAAASDSKAASALRTLANLGSSPNIAAGTLPSGSAAQYNPATNTVTWDQSQVNAAVASGQSAGEILFHELVHAYLNTSAYAGAPANTSISVAVGGYVVTYNTSQPAAVSAYEHALVSNAVQSAYGSDGTGSTEEAFGYNGSGTTDAGVSVKTSDGKAVTGEAAVKAAADASKSSRFATPNNPNPSFASAMAQNGTTCPSSQIRRAAAFVQHGFVKSSTIDTVHAY